MPETIDPEPSQPRPARGREMDEFATKATGSSAIRVSRVRRVPTLRAETSRARAEATRSRVLCAHAGMCWLLPSSPTSPLFLLLQRRSRRVPAVPPLPERETEHPAPFVPGPGLSGSAAQRKLFTLGGRCLKRKTTNRHSTHSWSAALCIL